MSVGSALSIEILSEAGKGLRKCRPGGDLEGRGPSPSVGGTRQRLEEGEVLAPGIATPFQGMYV